MALALTIAAVLISALLFGWAVPLVRLYDAFQPMIVALSIMVAAVFVRLNRGMPSLEWKSTEPGSRAKLTEKLYDLAVEYGRIIAVNFVTLAGLVVLSVIGKDAASSWTPWAQRIAAGGVGFMFALSASRMAYVVWRDIDIVRLQKELIDKAASSEGAQAQSAAAEEKVTSIRAAGVRKVDIPRPKAWGE